MPIIKSIINANGIEIRVSSTNESDYISLTDIAKKRNPEFPADVIKKLDALKKYNRIFRIMGKIK